ncbi:protein kinase C theta type-like [Anomaloglossus baeobatrachus]|uniref:protein kinase C theta type-like n=1 Tax=Anomaloglossus baeobatrachus TaxID=238106 RepID=UPI003F50A400
MELKMESLRKRKRESIEEVPKKRKIETSGGDKDGTNQNLIKAPKRPGIPIQQSIESKRKRGQAMGDKADDESSVSPKAEPELNMECLRKRKGESIDEVPKKRRTDTSDEKDGTNQSLIKAAKRPGSPIQESIESKRKRGEAMGDKADDGSSVSPKADTEQLSGTTPAESPIIVTGLESFTFHKILGEGGFGKVSIRNCGDVFLMCDVDDMTIGTSLLHIFSSRLMAGRAFPPVLMLCILKVMLATHKASQQQVAVKMVKKRLLLNISRDKILIERQVLEMTRKSPFITRAFATFQSQDYLFYVMEYLSRGDLIDIMSTNAPFPISATRDIKPDNILLDSTGHLKIADFGLAVMNIFGDTKTSGWAGTRLYMAPEILQNKPYNRAVDWFSAGLVIYMMATGRHPFYRGKIGRALKAIINDDPVFPNEMDPQLKAIINGLLDKSAENRQKFVENIRDHPFFMEINWTDIEEATAFPSFQLPPPPVMTSDTMKDVLCFTEANNTPIAETGQNLFCGFTFANEGWKVIESIPKPVISNRRPVKPHRRTFGSIVKDAFHRIWRRIKPWK